ncbi:prolyl-tRNA synthetase, family II [Halobacteroides halobius DSM 5150]|uniref:Proline--tRNA ligase n=1 Tax=Halobacteroides halobius (strain ATCC 35273 / DSM 5150 / MD-1) TaxID=748449 RepID=L0K7Z4_HALHC|nr:proline--tRNA ligase [Halobacteroides halobius]AGB40670.1 prolyl-tRNA synthetase, family II [Halobacteroides halobius DSM 5150]
MRMSQMYLPTLKETPADAEVTSHKLMLRAGMIRKLGSGIYTYLPLGYKAISNLEEIIKEELNKKGAQELLLPALQPASLWEESGRLENYGPELMRLEDRHAREFCLGPTHEEVITDLVRDEVRSYKELPLNLYQIQTKYRDEVRPRFGVLRGREFIMKDAYSFDADEKGLNESYQQMYDAYCNIFSRCGLEYRPVLADTGTIGGDDSHEFMVLADAGEDIVVYCEECDYAANLELATADSKVIAQDEEAKELKVVDTPEVSTIEDLVTELDLAAHKMIKAVLYQVDEEPVLALVRGDYEINEVKLGNILDVVNLELAAEEVYQKLDTVKGFTGPVKLEEIKIVADELVMEMSNAVSGANKLDQHYLNVNPGRDFKVTTVADIREVKVGEDCIQCGSQLKQTRGIEVGQVFKLGTKYSKALEATFLDQNGKPQPLVMGCYGIGVSRTIAAAIEQNHDEYGIKWPKALAPYNVELLVLGSGEVMEQAEEFYQQLKEEGIEVLLDDRAERAGVKFNDADLIGAPIRVTIGARSLADGKVEVKLRQTGEEFKVEVEEFLAKIESLLTDSIY